MYFKTRARIIFYEFGGIQRDISGAIIEKISKKSIGYTKRNIIL